MKKIIVVATGGTIAGIGEKGKTVAYHAGEINIDDILVTIPNVTNLANIEIVQFLNVDSNEMNMNTWIALSNTINEIIVRDDVDGIVVTHGTDTIEETSYFLNLTICSDKPVVLTGAMRPATATSADGPYNLYQAIALAANDEAHGQGVMVLFSNTIYSGRDIQKVNNYKIDAFDQKSFGCLGYMQDEKAYFFSKTFKTHTSQSIFSKKLNTLDNVAIAYYYAGADSDILEYLAKNHKGIVLVGSGNGNYSKSWLQMINTCYEKYGTIFVRASRVPLGIVFNDHVFDPKEYCIASNTLSAQKARILLALALSHTRDILEIKEIFSKY